MFRLILIYRIYGILIGMWYTMSSNKAVWRICDRSYTLLYLYFFLTDEKDIVRSRRKSVEKFRLSLTSILLPEVGECLMPYS